MAIPVSLALQNRLKAPKMQQKTRLKHVMALNTHTKGKILIITTNSSLLSFTVFWFEVVSNKIKQYRARLQHVKLFKTRLYKTNETIGGKSNAATTAINSAM